MCVWSVLCVQAYEAFLCAIPVVLMSVVSFQSCAFICKARSHAEVVKLTNSAVRERHTRCPMFILTHLLWHESQMCASGPLGHHIWPHPHKIGAGDSRGLVGWSCSRIIEEQVAVLKYSPEAAQNLATAHKVRLEDGLEAGKGARAHGAGGIAQKGWSVMAVEESSGKDGSLLEADQEGKQEAGRWGETTERSRHHN